MTGDVARLIPVAGGGTATGRSFSNRAMVALLRSPLHGLLGGGMVALRYPARDGRLITLPVCYVLREEGLVVLVGESAGKRWWRHFRRSGPVQVWWRGAWHPSTARAVEAGTTEHRDAVDAYRRGRPKTPVTVDDPVVLIPMPRAAPATTSRRRLWRSWTGLVTLGESSGSAFRR